MNNKKNNEVSLDKYKVKKAQQKEVGEAIFEEKLENNKNRMLKADKLADEYIEINKIINDISKGFRTPVVSFVYRVIGYYTIGFIASLMIYLFKESAMFPILFNLTRYIAPGLLAVYRLYRDAQYNTNLRQSNIKTYGIGAKEDIANLERKKKALLPEIKSLLPQGLTYRMSYRHAEWTPEYMKHLSDEVKWSISHKNFDYEKISKECFDAVTLSKGRVSENEQKQREAQKLKDMQDEKLRIERQNAENIKKINRQIKNNL